MSKKYYSKSKGRRHNNYNDDRNNYYERQNKPEINISGNLYGINFSANIDIEQTVNYVSRRAEQKRRDRKYLASEERYLLEDNEYYEEDEDDE
jgi:hypothetical protein